MTLDLEKLKELCAKATNRPWQYRIPAGRDMIFSVGELRGPVAEVRSWSPGDDAAFIVAAREALPELIAEVERLREENDRLKTEVAICRARPGDASYAELDTRWQAALRTWDFAILENRKLRAVAEAAKGILRRLHEEHGKSVLLSATMQTELRALDIALSALEPTREPTNG